MALFPDPRQAVAALNRYALNVGFPALIVVGLLDDQPLPTEPAFWLLWPLALAALVFGIRAFAPRAEAGTLALVAAFGNVAYLGLPYVLALYGPSVAGPAPLAVSIHVTLSVTVGPVLLELWGRGGEATWAPAVGRVLRMPLFWAPIAGLAGRSLPAGVRDGVSSWVDPLAASAAPVALFVIGLHVFLERRRLARVDGGLVAHLAVRQLLAPGLVTALALGASALGLLSPELARVHVVLAAAPAAITTFAIAEGMGVGEHRIASVVVWSSVLALVVLPAWSWVAG